MRLFASTFMGWILLAGNATAQHSVVTPVADAASANPESVGQEVGFSPFLDLDNEVVSSSATQDQGIDKDLLINFALWLIVILCLCGLTAVGLRMLNRRGVVNMGVPSGARVVESLSLGKHRFVQLVEIGGHSVLVASDASGIQSVVPLADEFSQTLLDATGPLSESGS